MALTPRSVARAAFVLRTLLPLSAAHLLPAHLAAAQQPDAAGVLGKINAQQRRGEPAAGRALPVVLTIEGGGSLGVHEAGMTWALVELFKAQDDLHAERAHDPRLPRLRLSAVSGASAGSINALLAATAWCDRRSELPPERSAAWQAWVPTGVQQLLPRHTTEGHRRAAGVFSRVYFRDVVYPMLDTAWAEAEWDEPAHCRVPVGATLTRLVPERVTLGDGLITAVNQRWAATFVLTTRRDARGRAGPVFLAERKHGSDRLMGSVAVPVAGADGVVAHGHIFDIFAASSGYPLAFGPYALQYQRPVPGGWRTETAQFSDGGVFDNGPLGLGLALHFGGGDWPRRVARAPFPMTVFVTPGRRRVWHDRRFEDDEVVDDAARLMDRRASGAGAVFSLLAGAVPSARQSELQRTLRDIAQLDSSVWRAVEVRPEHLVFPTTRWHPIAGSRLSGFGAFLGRPLREYDFYVGVYDAFATVTEGQCRPATPADSARRAEAGQHGRRRQFECMRDRLGAFITAPPINLGPVAPAVLRALYAREFGRALAPAPAPPAAADSASVHLALTIERAMGAFMRDTSRASRDRAAALRACPDEGGPLVGAVCGSGLYAVATALRRDTLAWRILRDRRGAGHTPRGDACARWAAPDALSATCLAEERFVEFVDRPMQEMHRVARSFLDRVIVTTPSGGAGDFGARALGAYYFSSDARYRRGFDMGQTSIPPREGRWHLLPSSVTAVLGVPGVMAGWEGRFNASSRVGLVLPARAAFGRFSTRDSASRDLTPRLVAGPAVEWRAEWGWVNAVRAGYNQWLGADRAWRQFSFADQGGAYAAATLFANKMRVAVGQRPPALRGVRRSPVMGEVGVADVNGLLYWARKGARGGAAPFRGEPSDAAGCERYAPRGAGPLAVGEQAVVAVRAYLASNPTGVRVDSGATYHLGARGWWRDASRGGFASAAGRPARPPAPGRPAPANPLELMGELLPRGREPAHRIGEGRGEWTAERSGELVVFANGARTTAGAVADADDRGCVMLAITRVR